MLLRLLKRLLLLLIATVLAVGLAEVALRVIAPSSNDYFLWPPHLQRRTQPPTEVFDGVSGPSSFSVNALGLRADTLQTFRTPVVLALGGSTTECQVLDQEEAWPHLLQVALAQALARARDPPGAAPHAAPHAAPEAAAGAPARKSPAPRPWVGNAGRSGHGTREHVFQAPRLLDMLARTGPRRVDLLLVMAGVNDLGLRLQRDTAYDPGFLDAPDVEVHQIPRAFFVHPLAYAGHLPSYKRTEVWAFARKLKNRLAAGLEWGAQQPESAEDLVQWRANRSAATELRTTLPPLQTALAEYEANLTRIVEAAAERDVTVVLLTQASLWRPDLDAAARATLWWGGVGDFQVPGARVPYYSVEALAEGMARYNEATLRVAERTGVPSFDLAAAVPRTTDMFYDDMHFTEAGARRVAEAVADFLVTSGLAGFAGESGGWGESDDAGGDR